VSTWRERGWIEGIARVASGDELGDPAFEDTPDTNVNDWYLHTEQDLSIGIRRDYGDDEPIVIVGTSSRLTAECPGKDEIAWVMESFDVTEYEIVKRDNWWAYVRIIKPERRKEAMRIMGAATALSIMTNPNLFMSEQEGRALPDPPRRKTVATRETMRSRIKQLRKGKG